MNITSDKILELGETQSIEFKKSLSLQKEALEALCGMINTDYAKGAIVFGVEPDGTICGIEIGNIDTAQKSLVHHIHQKFEPDIICSVKMLECEEKLLLYLQAERNKEVPYHEYNGRAYIREGSSRRQLSYEEKRQLSIRRDRNKHNGPWKCDHCGMVVGMLLGMVVTDNGIRKTYDCECGGEFWPM